MSSIVCIFKQLEFDPILCTTTSCFCILHFVRQASEGREGMAHPVPLNLPLSDIHILRYFVTVITYFFVILLRCLQQLTPKQKHDK